MRMLEHPSVFGHGTRTGLSIGGVFVLLIAGLGFFWMYPEIKRYLRIRRM